MWHTLAMMSANMWPFQQIAELLAEYKIADGRSTVPPSPRARLEELPVNIPRGNRQLRQAELFNEFENEENEPEDDAQTVTDTTASTTDDTDRQHMPPPKLSKAETRAVKKAAKAAKSTTKAAKNQKKHVINVRAEDVSFVAEVLHGTAANGDGATHPLASDKTIEEVIARNISFLSGIDDHKRLLLSSIAQRRRSDRDRRKSSSAASGASNSSRKRRFSERTNNDDSAEEDEMDDLLVAALVKLGVAGEHARAETNGAAGPGAICVAAKKKGTPGKDSASTSPQQIPSIIALLKALIRDDLERHENEQRETCVRAGGFWRYVGRPVFERMTAIAKELDWKTGMKFKEVNGNVEAEE
jgi:hypothetical protein